VHLELQIITVMCPNPLPYVSTVQIDFFIFALQYFLFLSLDMVEVITSSEEKMNHGTDYPLTGTELGNILT
jgi:hypothetical protein